MKMCLLQDSRKTIQFVEKVRIKYAEVAEKLTRLNFDDDQMASFADDRSSFTSLFDVQKLQLTSPFSDIAAGVANQFVWKQFQDVFTAASAAGKLCGIVCPRRQVLYSTVSDVGGTSYCVEVA